MRFEKKFNFIVLIGLFLWAFFFLLYAGYQHIQHFSTTSELLLCIAILIINWQLWKISSSSDKQYFLLFFISFLGILISDLNYAFIFLIKKVGLPSNFEAMLYIIPYFIFVSFQGVFWLKIVRNYIIKAEVNLLTLVPFFVVGFIVIAIYIIASLVLVKHFTYITRAEMFLGAIDLFVSSLVILVLICSRNKGLYLNALASCMIMATNFWWMYLYHNRALGVADYSGSFWLLALILAFFGSFYLLHTKQISLSHWFSSLRGIKSQVTLWTFSLSILSVLILCFLGYSFNLIDFYTIQSLPFLLIIYSVIIILISNLIGNIFEGPFKKIQKNIERLVATPNSLPPVQPHFYTEEFQFLQNFITDTFHVYEERNKEKKAIAELALQVAHDIRSPVAAISMLSEECLELPERQRITMKDAANRIQDIANYLLSQFGPSPINHANNELRPLLISTAVLSVLSEKRMQFKNKNISFLYEANNASFSFIKINRVEFERMLSNLINNAVEAIIDKGAVSIILIEEGENLMIKIIDTGKGMPEGLVKNIMNRNQISSDKSTGHGLGLAHALSLLEKIDASLNIISEINKGTTITVTFKTTAVPCWIADHILFNEDDHIIILDDDTSIHGAWDKKFSDYVKEYPALKIIHFTKASECLDYMKKFPVLSKFLLLVDYELINQNLTGLDIVRILNPIRSILVTSHYESVNIIKQSILLKTKILPKVLASSANLILHNVENNLTSHDNEDIDLVVLEDNKEFSEILAYLYESRGKRIKIYTDPYQLLESIGRFGKQTKICVDYNLGCPVNGVELAGILKSQGYNNLYLATGMRMFEENVPEFIKVLNEKMDLLNL